METKIYWILMQTNPNVLNELDKYQKKHYGVGIERPKDRPKSDIEFEYKGENLDIIQREMAKKPRYKR